MQLVVSLSDEEDVPPPPPPHARRVVAQLSDDEAATGDQVAARSTPAKRKACKLSGADIYKIRTDVAKKVQKTCI